MPPRSFASIAALTALLFVLALSIAPAARAGTFDRDTTWAHTGLAASPSDGSARWSALAMLADGRFLAAGRTVGGQAAVARFTAAGELDTTWASDQPVPGLLVVSAQAGVTPAALVLLPDGKVLLGGTTLAVDFTPSLVVARLTADGHLDPSFATAGKIITTSGRRDGDGQPRRHRRRPHPHRRHLLRRRHDRPRAGRAPDRRRRP